jgi:hypothetical protein
MFKDPVFLLIFGITCGIVVGMAVSIVFNHAFGRFFGSKREKELLTEVKDLRSRLRKKDDLIKKAVKDVEKINARKNE